MKLSDIINILPSHALSEMTMNTTHLPQQVVDSYVLYLEKHGNKWADALGGKTIDKVVLKGLDIYGLRDHEGTLISFATLKPKTYNGDVFYQLNTISTVGNAGGGFYPQLTLLWTIKEHIKKPIIDYGSQTPKAKRFLQALAKTGRFNVFWYNTQTGEKEKYDASTDFNKSKYRGVRMTNWRVLVECESTPAFPKNALDEGFPFGIPHELFEFTAVPVVGPDASRPTPAASLQHYGAVNAPLPHKFCKDRDWCEQKEKKKKKRKKLKDLEARIDNATPRPY